MGGVVRDRHPERVWWATGDGAKILPVSKRETRFLRQTLISMILCRVVGSVVATVKNDRLPETRLLLVQKLGIDGELSERAEEVALDPGLDAGVGDTVLVAKEGAVVADLFDRDAPAGALPTPANVVIVAVVDAWTGGKEPVTSGQ